MSDVVAVNNLVKKYKELQSEISKVIIGQQEAVNFVLLSIFCGGILFIFFQTHHKLSWLRFFGIYQVCLE